MSTHSDYYLKSLQTALGKKNKSDWAAVCTVSLKRSSSQALGEKLKKRFSKFQFLCQNTANTLGFDPCECPPPTSGAPAWLFTARQNLQSPSQKLYLVWCQIQFGILLCHTLSQENLNAFFALPTEISHFQKIFVREPLQWLVPVAPPREVTAAPGESARCWHTEPLGTTDKTELNSSVTRDKAAPAAR